MNVQRMDVNLLEGFMFQVRRAQNINFTSTLSAFYI